MLHWYCKATYNLGQFLFPKTTYNLERRKYSIKATSAAEHFNPPWYFKVKNCSKLQW